MAPATSAYLREFRLGWRPLLAATIGLSAGMALNAYVTSIFGPYLIDAFGWSKSQFALVGAINLVTLLLIPLVGRLTDLYGVRLVALPGIIGYPASLLLLSSMSGDIGVFYAIVLFQALASMSTTTTVYSRVVAEQFSLARGMALAICACGPAVAGALASPLLTAYNEAFGWRAGYQVLAGFSIVMGLLTLALLPREKVAPAQRRQQRDARRDYAGIARSPVFWIVLAAAFLCSLPHALAFSQVKVMLLEHGVNATQAGYMVSVFAVGVLAGRFGAGVALDRMPTYLVSAIVMGLPAIGLLVLASDTTSLLALGFAVVLLGLSFGGEADVLAYATADYFPIGIYSSVFGLLTSAVGVAIGLGSLMLSFTLSLSDSFSLYMYIAAATTFAGAANLLRLRSHAPVRDEVTA
ncbi:MFS transporter [Mangrovimicrobium sediminis]|uniref:MFS transporter n=1 Tax=Mangrovimicrobium sediminis TaxID=2562682 RepID=A0A4Z0LX50_9GAMM|nr:MFS transporter [Haliea sp. SAOS-164]TGD71804.1 MFS transporter [Haliea sp. SAOS-164]